MKYLIVTFFLVWVHAPALADSGIPEKSFPLPIAEMNTVVLDWMTASGFEVQQVDEGKGRIVITAREQNNPWQIFLNSRSPLATKLRIDSKDGDPANGTRLEDLSRHISAYLDSPKKEIQSYYQKIPKSIASRMESIVCIQGNTGNESFQVSGFIIDPAGVIICTAHNLSKASALTVVFFRGQKHKGRIVKIDYKLDLALVRVESQSDRFVSPAAGRNLLELGEQLFSVGCPGNLRGTVFSGVVNSPPRRANGVPLWQVNMQIHPGSSGSPVFDIQGNLVGVIKGRYWGTDSIGFLIPLESVMTFLNDI
jgi:serine protease Do